MRIYKYNGVEYVITEEEFEDLLAGWIKPEDLFG